MRGVYCVNSFDIRNHMDSCIDLVGTVIFAEIFSRTNLTKQK